MSRNAVSDDALVSAAHLAFVSLLLSGTEN